MTEALVRATGLVKTFGQTKAVNGVDLQVHSGEIYALVGPDGAGKTSTIRLLCGALRPDAGSVMVDNIDMIRNPERAREQIGYLSQRFSLYEDLTVLENLRFFAEVRGLPSQDWQPRSRQILEFVGLSDFGARPAGKLSGGMKQKLGLAGALVHRPRVLLLDEPTGGVDPVTRQDFWRLIIRLATDEGISTLISTPYMDEAARCSRVGFMLEGRIAIESSPGNLRQQLSGRLLEAHLETSVTEIRRKIEIIEGVEDVQAFGDRLHLRTADGAREMVVKRLAEILPGLAVFNVEPTLEDVFIMLLQKNNTNDSEGHHE